MTKPYLPAELKKRYSGPQPELYDQIAQIADGGAVPVISPTLPMQRREMAPQMAPTLPQQEAQLGAPSMLERPEASFQLPDGSTQNIFAGQPIAPAFGREQSGDTTFNVDGGSVTMPSNLAVQTMGLDKAPAPDVQLPSIENAPDLRARTAAVQARLAQSSAQRPDFFRAVSDRERRGTGEMSMEAATRLAGGNRPQAAAMIEAQRQQPQQAEEGVELSERERRVDALVNTLGIPPSRALGIVEGVEKVITDPVSGESLIYNEATQETTPLDMAPEISKAFDEVKPAEPSDPQKTLAEMARESTGLLPSFKLAVQTLAGQEPVGLKVSDAPEIANMRQQVEVAKRSLIRALSLNPRYPVSEQEAVSKEINISPSAFSDPITMEARIGAVDSALRKRLENEKSASNDKTLPRSTRQAARQAANDIQNYLDLLGADEDVSEPESNGGEIDELLNIYAPQ